MPEQQSDIGQVNEKDSQTNNMPIIITSLVKKPVPSRNIQSHLSVTMHEKLGNELEICQKNDVISSEEIIPKSESFPQEDKKAEEKDSSPKINETNMEEKMKENVFQPARELDPLEMIIACQSGSQIKIPIPEKKREARKLEKKEDEKSKNSPALKKSEESSKDKKGEDSKKSKEDAQKKKNQFKIDFSLKRMGSFLISSLLVSKGLILLLSILVNFR